MGFADMLLKLNIPYNSEEAVEVAEKVVAFIQQESRQASANAGRPTGQLPRLPRQQIRRQRPGPHAQRHHHHHRPHRHHQHHLPAAPAASSPCSRSPSCAGSWKAPNWSRSTPTSKKLAKSRGFYSPELMKNIASTGSIRDFKEIPQDVRRLFVTAHEVSPQWHIRLQAAWQKYTDNAVSKTVNFPKQATPDDVRQAYLMAFDLGLKGVTIYRDGSREEQVLSFGEQAPKLQYITPRPRPERTTGVTELITTGCGKLYVTVNQDNLGFCEVFAQMGKTGGCASLPDRVHRPPHFPGPALRGQDRRHHQADHRHPLPQLRTGKRQPGALLPRRHRPGDRQRHPDRDLRKRITHGLLPGLRRPVVHENGCLNCHSCGFSRCS